MAGIADIFENPGARPPTRDGVYSEYEVGLANRNSGFLLETLAMDVTPTGAHYLLTHFDVPLVDADTHRLEFGEGFDAPFALSLDEIRALPKATMPVTMECAGNGRRRASPRCCSMPWGVEAVGTSLWGGTPLAPLIERARPRADTADFVFLGADRGFDKGVEHAFGRSLTPDELRGLDILLVYEMNGQPLLPQHGAPLRLIVPGWYGMASVKWLARIEASHERYQGFQQVETYRYRESDDDPGRPVTRIRVKSLMIPPGAPDWLSRARYLRPGPVTIKGRAWSGGGVPVRRVELGVNGDWIDAKITPAAGPYAWSGWSAEWNAAPGDYTLRCRATDANGETQPLEARWDMGGFGNNMAQTVQVHVAENG